MATHYFPTDRVHFTWDTGNEPVLTIADGDTVVFETRDVCDNQIGPGSDSSVIARLDWDRVYPLVRAGLRRGRRAGRHARDRDPRPAHQGLGLDGDPARARPAGRRLHRALPARLRPRRATHDLPRGHLVPLAPFMGTMGVCPAGASAQPIMPPGTFGGNMDTRQLVAGTTLYLPVSVEGALFSTGDAHGCQGDGEICVTGLEAPMYATMRFRVEKRTIPAPQYRTAPGPLTPAVDFGAFFAHHRRRRRPLRERPERDPGDDRPPRRDARPLARGRLPALLAGRGPEDLRDRRRGPVTSSPPSCRRRSSVEL